MPYFSIETNKVIEEPSHQTLLKITSVFVAKLLGKPESYVMVQIRPNSPLLFAGKSDRAAFVQLKSIGLPRDRCPEFAEKISEFIEQEFQIPRDRVFIDFEDLAPDMFALNGKTF